jgi:four helix bundle protein
LERTARFGESIIAFAKRVPIGRENDPLVSQLVRAGTSVGANYCEADDRLSRKDYLKSIGICRKESKETKFWLRMVVTAVPDLKDAARPLSLARGQRTQPDLRIDFSKEMNTMTTRRWNKAHELPCRFRTSGFGLVSDFGRRHSDFPNS